MKKIITVAAAFLAAGFLFAEAQVYTVKNLKGSVEYQVGSDKWAKLEPGKALSSTTVVNVGAQSAVVLVDANGKELKLSSYKKGSIEALAKGTAGAGGIKKATITKSDVSEKSAGGSKGVATASSRASEAQADQDWNE